MTCRTQLFWPLAASFLFFLSGCATEPLPATKLKLEAVSFSDLPGWSADHVTEALPALQNSCATFRNRSPDASLGLAGFVRDWQPVCRDLQNSNPSTDAALQAFLEAHFTPYAAATSAGRTGLFTGYYEAELHGARQPDARFRTPLYAKPRDLVSVDLGLFRPELKGERIEGKVVQQKLELYDDRAAIANASLDGRADVLFWVDDPVDAFFLEVQGSGRVTLQDGSTVRVGYDAPNGRGYAAIGRIMADLGDIEKPVTMQKIRDWFRAHPDQAQSVMNKNKSYIFFRVVDGNGPIGAEGVALTAKRSLAVDPSFVPLGVPLWLDASDGHGTPLERLMVAQDTGGAIKGPIRGDFFWGYGSEAAAAAGAMQGQGTYYLLLPNLVTPNR